ncbi:hypothetical protein J6590_051741 [Homalodisca vitripennis]|nr:hypothetical protein J6590_051741 [Homalodisca vitripennis]
MRVSVSPCRRHVWAAVICPPPPTAPPRTPPNLLIMQPITTAQILINSTSPYRKQFQPAHLNAQSLRCHIDEVRTIFMNQMFDVITISESWLKPSVPDGEEYSAEPEFIFLEIDVSVSEVLLLGLCYRPPKVGHMDDFEDTLLRLLSGYGHDVSILQPDYILPLNATHYTAKAATWLDLMVVSRRSNGLSHPEFLKTLRSAVNVYNVSSPMNPIHKPSTPLTQEISTQPQVHPSDSTCNTVSPESPESLTPSTALTLTTNLIAASSPNSPSGSYCNFTPHQTLDLNSPLIAQRSPI